MLHVGAEQSEDSSRTLPPAPARARGARVTASRTAEGDRGAGWRAWGRPSGVLPQDALGSSGVHQARVAIRLGLAGANAERCDAIETGPAAAGHKVGRGIGFGDEA